MVLTFQFYMGEAEDCEIPLNGWIAGFYFFQTLDIIFEELRGRLTESQYYDIFRLRRNILRNGLLGLEGISTTAWTIYGLTLYFSSDSDGCSDENAGLVILMVLLLIIGGLRFICFWIGLGIMAYMVITRRTQRRRLMNASV